MSDNIVEDTQDSTEVKKEVSQKLNKKKLSFQKLSIHEYSFDIESSYFPSRPHGHDSSSKRSAIPATHPHFSSHKVN